jgi:hypothetical protein
MPQNARNASRRRKPRSARLADAEPFVLAQARLIVFAATLRAGDWRGTLVIVRHADGAVLEPGSA